MCEGTTHGEGFLVATRDMYVVMVREKGMFLVEPVPGRSQRETVEEATGVQGGYSAGLVPVELPEGATEAWACWVEGEANGQPYFFFKAFASSLSEDEVTAQLREAGEEPLKMNLTPIHYAPPPGAPPETR
jgi:hypothetical protein